MDRTGLITVLFVIVLVSDVSSATYDLKFRKLADSETEAANNSSQTQVRPTPSTPPSAKELSAKEKGDSTSSTNNTAVPQVVNNTSPPVTESSNGTSSVGSPISKQPGPKNEDDKQSPPGKEGDKQLSPPGKKGDKQLSPPGKESAKQLNPPSQESDKHLSPEGKESDKIKKLSPPTGIGKNCEGKRIRCQVRNTITACIHNAELESKEWIILVQNDAEESLKVNLTVPTSVEDNKEVLMGKHEIQEIDVPRTIGKRREISLSTKNGTCVLQPPLLEESSILHLPTEQLLTPINGAYLLILTVVSLGGVWACCMFQKRRRHGSVAYQELEMASPETAGAAAAETAEGWDQVWDDDWDEENAVKSPGHRISANGLTSRPGKRDGWENDWDD